MKFEYNPSKVANYFEVIGILNIKNKCCSNEPVLITKTKGQNVYSCQCGCGGWCTDGFSTIQGAINDWVRMNN